MGVCCPHRRMQTGENWDDVMQDCMVLQQCIEVTQNFNVTLPGTNATVLIWAGTYLDSLDDVATISLLPSDVKVGPGARNKRGGEVRK